MNHTLRQHRALKRAHGNFRVRKPQRAAQHKAAHPILAAALTKIGERSTDGIERIVENGAFLAIAFLAACALLWARAQGWIA